MKRSKISVPTQEASMFGLAFDGRILTTPHQEARSICTGDTKHRRDAASCPRRVGLAAHHLLGGLRAPGFRMRAALNAHAGAETRPTAALAVSSETQIF